ncbi:SprT-like domain-containing protein [Paraburkholderia sp. GAS32]|uniref:SprT-like domain-containing protein n=1 Tax=Paraburkholderia sp. GAS32 TaxID=3035129 RepID=UPI003D1AEB66
MASDQAMTPTAEAYAELEHAYSFFKRELFDGEIDEVLLTLDHNNPRTLGYCAYKRFGRRSGEIVDQLAMNPGWFSTRSIRETLQTLVHEMVHTWQRQKGKPGRGGYHNKEWGDMMQKVGLMPSNTGKPGGRKTGDQMMDYVIEGGPFDVACAKLLTDEFTLSWLDRYPPQIALDHGRENGHKPGSPKPGRGDDDDDDSDDDEENELPDGLIVEPGDRGKDRDKDKSNRVKFTCPVCGENAWGRPSLRVLCGGQDCNAPQMLPGIKKGNRPNGRRPVDDDDDSDD